MNEYVNMVRTWEWLCVVLPKICLCAERMFQLTCGVRHYTHATCCW